MAMTMAPVGRGAGIEPGELLFDVDYPDRLSRGLIFIKWLLAIPQLIVVALLTALVGYIVTPIAWLCILVVGRYPRGMWDFSFGVMRWTANVYAYLLLQRDEYPPFSMDSGQYPVTFEMIYPPRLSRLLIFVKWLLIIPSFVVLYILLIIMYLVLFLAWFAILFTGRNPRGLFDFTTGVMRWAFRVNVYVLLLSDKYPPFRMSQ
jgi:hypothetical protein